MVETWRPGAVRRKVSGHLSGPMPQLHNEHRTLLLLAAVNEGGGDDDAIKGPLGSRERANERPTGQLTFRCASLIRSPDRDYLIRAGPKDGADGGKCRHVTRAVKSQRRESSRSMSEIAE